MRHPFSIDADRRKLLAIGATTVAASMVSPRALAQETYPSRPVRWVLPFAVGGGSDILARILAREIEKDLGQSVIVDNRPGGNTMIATQALLGYPSDGYTMMSVGIDTLVTNPYIYKVPYDANRDFALVATMARFPHVLVARKDFPGRTPQESLEAIRRAREPVLYATWGNGSMAHLAMEALLQRLQAKGTAVAYKGSAPGLQDMMGGRVDLFICDVASAQEHIRAGSIKAIGIPSRMRYAGLPDVPTLTEVGVTDFDLILWQGVMMRSNTPPTIVERVSAAFKKALTDPATAKVLEDRGFQPLYRTPKEFREFVKDGDAFFGNVIKQAGIKSE